MVRYVQLSLLVLAFASALNAPAGAQAPNAAAQWRLRCAVLSGDLTDPVERAGYFRCLSRGPAPARHR